MIKPLEFNRANVTWIIITAQLFLGLISKEEYSEAHSWLCLKPNERAEPIPRVIERIWGI